MSGRRSWLRRRRARSGRSDATACGPASWLVLLCASAPRFGHRNDVLEVGIVLQKVEQIGMRKAAVEAHPDTRTGKAVGDHRDQTTQNSPRSHRSGHVAGTQHSRTQILFGFVIEAHKAHYWQVAPAVIVSVEER